MGQIAQQDKIIFTNKKGSWEPPFNPEDWGGVNIAYKLRDCVNGSTISDVLLRTKEKGNKISTASILSWNILLSDPANIDYSIYFCRPDGTI